MKSNHLNWRETDRNMSCLVSSCDQHIRSISINKTRIMTFKPAMFCQGCLQYYYCQDAISRYLLIRYPPILVKAIQCRSTGRLARRNEVTPLEAFRIVNRGWSDEPLLLGTNSSTNIYLRMDRIIAQVLAWWCAIIYPFRCIPLSLQYYLANMYFQKNFPFLYILVKIKHCHPPAHTSKLFSCRVIDRSTKLSADMMFYVRNAG